VPRNNPPKITVNGRDYVWKEGEGVLFDDSWPHAVVNHSDDLRAVLIVDVRRPLPLTGDLVNRFVTNVVGRYAYGRAVARKADQFTRLQFS
jgi:aspartyl/asparaginyl beta-hydroxylase (cupin superfamily)